MAFFDLVRYAVFATFGIGTGFMLLTNGIAFRVLRPPQKLGFLWWHVTAISLSFLCISIVAIDTVAGKFGTMPGWRSALTLFGMTLYMTAQAIIFSIERQRLVVAKAMGKVEAVSPSGDTYDGE